MILINDEIQKMVHAQWLELMPMLQMKGISVEQAAKDSINPVKSARQYGILSKFQSLKGMKLLEVGSGLGVNLAGWIKDYQADGYGIEPDSEGFKASLKISKKLFEVNGIDPGRIVNAVGEKIPFDDNSFDIVYSTNALEHTTDPALVLAESMRVLKPGGLLQFVYPNYHSFFDGHYAVFHPPVFFKAFFPWYIKHVCGRDNSFAKTIRTELNMGWTKKNLKQLSRKYKFEVLSFGEGTFYERMLNLDFEAWGGLSIVKKAVNLLKTLKINGLAAKICVLTGVFDPIILTIRKSNEQAENGR